MLHVLPIVVDLACFTWVFKFVHDIVLNMIKILFLQKLFGFVSLIAISKYQSL